MNVGGERSYVRGLSTGTNASDNYRSLWSTKMAFSALYTRILLLGVKRSELAYI